MKPCLSAVENRFFYSFVSRSDIGDKVFAKKLKAVELDGIIHRLLSENPCRINQIEVPRQDGLKGGRSRKLYRALP